MAFMSWMRLFMAMNIMSASSVSGTRR